MVGYVVVGGRDEWYVHNVPVLDKPRLRICIGFDRGCWGMTGYGEGRGTSLPLILRFMMMDVAMSVVDHGLFEKLC
jgi:hypothetical protein